MERKRAERDRGFTLIELLIVVAIIATLVAVTLPMISTYLTNYKMRSASGAIVNEINAARNKAITRNVHHGVVFVVRSPNTFQYVIEDLPRATSGAISGMAQDINTTDAVIQAQIFGPVRTLPQGVTFGTNCPGFDAGKVDPGFRFNSLGAWCDPGSNATTCPALPGPTGPALVSNIADVGTLGAHVCLNQGGLRRWVRVAPGGRVMTER